MTLQTRIGIADRLPTRSLAHVLTVALGLLHAAPALAQTKAPASAAAKDVAVSMLNTGKDGPMVFEPSYVRVNVGDTVVFKPVQPGGHNSTSVLTPAGAASWTGAFDKELRVKIDKEGVYLYACLPHKAMGMVGVIQAGKPHNLAQARVLAAKEAGGFALGKDRFDKALAQVK
jgi:pseudoazurin